MGEEEATNDEKKSPEMTPQEDGTKVLLNDDLPTVQIEEAKYVADPNGDAKIDIGGSPAFSGLTKEELMKYSNDPFWIRLRWFLFVLFWLGWLTMLIMAVVIIVRAPGCKPPPQLLWVEKGPMIALDSANLPAPEALISKCELLGVSSIYLSNYISSSNFDETNYDATDIIDAIAAKAEKETVTDLPLSIDNSNSLYTNVSGENLTLTDGSWNYNNDALASFVFEEIVKLWIDKGVKGFMMQNPDTPEKKKFLDDLNGLAKPEGGAVGSNMIETDNELENPTAFQAFLEEHSKTWTFYKFNPSHVAGSTIDKENLRLLTMGLFMAPGTPVLIDYDAVDNSTAELIKHLSEMKSLAGIQFGAIEFVNTTSEGVIAFTRVNKGTPAHAIALNFDGGNETVTFEKMNNIGETGTTKIQSQQPANYYSVKGKQYLNNVDLGPYEGEILEFVANF